MAEAEGHSAEGRDKTDNSAAAAEAQRALEEQLERVQFDLDVRISCFNLTLPSAIRGVWLLTPSNVQIAAFNVILYSLIPGIC